MAGVFELKSDGDLLAKLGRELERLRAAPNDVDHAFNFFVTAEHMLDWRYPDDPCKRKNEREKPLLQLVSHLANGAKHFDHLAKHHQSVASTGLMARHPNRMMQHIFPGELSVVAVGAAGEALGGSRITVLALAERVYAYWQQEVNPVMQPRKLATAQE